MKLAPDKIKLFFIAAIILAVSACASNPEANTLNTPNKTDVLAKEWHEQVKRNPNNVFDKPTAAYPRDNDDDYASYNSSDNGDNDYYGDKPQKAKRSSSQDMMAVQY